MTHLQRGSSSLCAQLAAQGQVVTSLLSSRSEVVLVCDRSGRVCHASPALGEVFGHAPAALSLAGMTSIVHPADLPALRRAVRDLLAGRLTGCVRCRLRHADGSWRVAEVSLSTVHDDACVSGLLLHAHDVTDQVQLERAMAHRAGHDELTGLANRVQIGEHLARALSASVDRRLAVVCLDLDGLQTINDVAGHLVGDALLVAVAQRLCDVVRADEMVARLGGAEFAVVLADVHAEAAELVAARLRAAVCRPYMIGQRELVVHASVGVAFAGPELGPDELVRNAGLAVRRAKAFGRDRIELYTPALQAEMTRRVDLEDRLRSALGRDEFELHYQPIVDLRDGSMAGAEALLRWRRPDATLAAPADFLDVAEDTGLIGPLGWWAFDTAVAQVGAWRRDGLDVGISVNLSARQLAQPTLVADVLSRLERLDVAPSALTLEITETVLVEQLEASDQRLRELRSEGVVIALDDFGTGFCGLGYLRGLSVDVLKLDRSFVLGLGCDHDHTVLVRTIVGLGRDLGLLVVAEGVESFAQVALLQEMGCPLAQGYLFEQPRGAVHAAAHARTGFGAALLAAAG